MKHLEGKEVWLRPTGNNIRRHINDDYNRCIKANVIKVARVFMTLLIDDATYETKLRMSERNKNEISNDFNSGYVLFESLEEFEDQLEVERLAKLIVDKYKYSSSWERVDLEIIRKIAELLKL